MVVSEVCQISWSQFIHLDGFKGVDNFWEVGDLASKIEFVVSNKSQIQTFGHF